MAGLKFVSAALVAVTEHVPVPLVMLRVAPLTEQAVEAPTLKVTEPVPLPPVVVSVCVEPLAAGDVTFTVSVAWLAIWTVTVAGAEVAGLKFASPALVAVTEHVPVPLVMLSVTPLTEQAVEAPMLSVTAPVPLPPVVVSVCVEPNVAGEVTFTESVA